ncbi:MAG: ATP-dependent metallopeptidase FtsH/Yme1/Tma family protein, partial [Caldilineaceae bacterium]|nr:ATP-dependent metallopeptidase FtsH/Yme1/Tma family protein [Caldilineaceae bacterium]
MDSKLSDKRFKFSIGYVIAALLIMALIRSLVAGSLLAARTEIAYSEFKSALHAGKIESVTVGTEQITGTFITPGAGAEEAGAPEIFSTVRVEDPELIHDLEAAGVEITGQVTSDGGIGAILGWILPLVLMFGFWYWMMGRMKKGGLGGGLSDMFSFGKSKARKLEGQQTGITFDDVGGAGEAITELREVTEFLKSPERFQQLGGKMPKGVLLLGSPGTGKTLLAKATAGEAGVAFFSLSGSEFVEMFVGVGASRVRDLFDQAKKSAPSIIFIDEIDAIGGRRGGVGAMGSHEEREQTLNQLLAEMDGFESTAGVIVMAATNRPEVLDPALLRPGRFDRQITVDLPDLVGREEILRIHTQQVVLADDVNLDVLARITPG